MLTPSQCPVAAAAAGPAHIEKVIKFDTTGASGGEGEGKMFPTSARPKRTQRRVLEQDYIAGRKSPGAWATPAGRPVVTEAPTSASARPNNPESG